VVNISYLEALGSLTQSETVTGHKSPPCRQIRGLLPSCYMDVTGVTLGERAQDLAQIERLVSSHALHGSESLCKLLRYLAKYAFDHPGIHPKEYQIATEVFGRQADFDPQLDSTIRVQAGRLRMKLAEYYSSEGAEDPILVELPKGAYSLSFHPRVSGRSKYNAGSITERQHGEIFSSRLSATTKIALFALSILLVSALVALWKTRRSTDTAVSGRLQPAPVAFQLFWKPFLIWPEEPTVVFSNAAFIGRPETGMRYYDSSRDSRDLIWDHYTGVGEVLSIHNLDQVFGMLHRGIRVKRGSLFSLDDAKNNDLIFVGSPPRTLRSWKSRIPRSLFSSGSIPALVRATWH